MAENRNKPAKKPPTLQVVTDRELLFRFKLAVMAQGKNMTDFVNDFMRATVAQHDAKSTKKPSK